VRQARADAAAANRTMTLRDIRGLNATQIEDLSAWIARTLLAATLAETTTTGGPPPVSPRAGDVNDLDQQHRRRRSRPSHGC